MKDHVLAESRLVVANAGRISLPSPTDCTRPTAGGYSSAPIYAPNLHPPTDSHLAAEHGPRRAAVCRFASVCRRRYARPRYSVVQAGEIPRPEKLTQKDARRRQPPHRDIPGCTGGGDTPRPDISIKSGDWSLSGAIDGFQATVAQLRDKWLQTTAPMATPPERNAVTSSPASYNSPAALTETALLERRGFSGSWEGSFTPTCRATAVTPATAEPGGYYGHGYGCELLLLLTRLPAQLLSLNCYWLGLTYCVAAQRAHRRPGATHAVLLAPRTTTTCR